MRPWSFPYFQVRLGISPGGGNPELFLTAKIYYRRSCATLRAAPISTSSLRESGQTGYALGPSASGQLFPQARSTDCRRSWQDSPAHIGEAQCHPQALQFLSIPVSAGHRTCQARHRASSCLRRLRNQLLYSLQNAASIRSSHNQTLIGLLLSRLPPSSADILATTSVPRASVRLRDA